MSDYKMIRKFFRTDQFHSAYFAIGLGLETCCLEALFRTRSPPEEFFHQVLEELHRRGFEEKEKWTVPLESEDQILTTLRHLDRLLVFTVHRHRETSRIHFSLFTDSDLDPIHPLICCFDWNGPLKCEINHNAICDGPEVPSAEFLVQHAFESH